MPVDENSLNKISYLKDKNLYLSRPFVEDGILTLKQEINLYEKIITDFGEIIVKFHPREEENKKNYLVMKLGLNEIDSSIQDIPAEKITLNIGLASLIGTFSNTLMYSSRFTEIPIYSYIKLVNHNHSTVNVFEEFMLNNFQEINFIDN